MKLGTQTGSLINHLHSRGTIGQPMPTVGMGATILRWSDRQAATVTEVFRVDAKGGCYITVREDLARVVSGSGHDGSAKYECTPDPAGSPETYRRADANGKWEQVRKNEATGRYLKTNGTGLRLGARDHYRDPSF